MHLKILDRGLKAQLVVLTMWTCYPYKSCVWVMTNYSCISTDIPNFAVQLFKKCYWQFKCTLQVHVILVKFMVLILMSVNIAPFIMVYEIKTTHLLYCCVRHTSQTTNCITATPSTGSMAFFIISSIIIYQTWL